jgi:hypothetical protein
MIRAICILALILGFTASAGAVDSFNHKGHKDFHKEHKVTLGLERVHHKNERVADPAFVVFYNSGKAIKTVNGKSIALKKGDQLLPSDKVTVPEKAQLVLVCANFSVVQLKTRGTFAVNALLAKCKTQQTSASSAYFKYVWNQFAHAHKAPEADPRAYMKTYGAASRGKGITTPLAVDTIYHYNGNLSIGWKQDRTLTVQVYATAAEEQLLLKGKPAKRIAVDSIAKVLAKPGSYYWDFAGEQSAKFKVLQLLTKSKYQQLTQSIISHVVATTPAETAYLTAYMLEEHHFLAEAAKYYEKAVKLMPNDEHYRAAYVRFSP